MRGLLSLLKVELATEDQEKGMEDEVSLVRVVTTGLKSFMNLLLKLAKPKNLLVFSWWWVVAIQTLLLPFPDMSSLVCTGMKLTFLSFYDEFILQRLLKDLTSIGDMFSHVHGGDEDVIKIHRN